MSQGFANIRCINFASDTTIAMYAMCYTMHTDIGVEMIKYE
jgi:hypothetical protein